MDNSTFPVAAAEGYVRVRSARSLMTSIHLENRDHRFYDHFAAERRLRQLLRVRENCQHA